MDPITIKNNPLLTKNVIGLSSFETSRAVLLSVSTGSSTLGILSTELAKTSNLPTLFLENIT